MPRKETAREYNEAENLIRHLLVTGYVAFFPPTTPKDALIVVTGEHEEIELLKKHFHGRYGYSFRRNLPNLSIQRLDALKVGKEVLYDILYPKNRDIVDQWETNLGPHN